MFKSPLILAIAYTVLLPLVFILEQMQPEIRQALALVPRNFSYWGGIISTVFIHKDLEHLSSNSLTLMICLYGLVYFYREIALKVILISHGLTGLLIWLFARPAFHIGASGLVYALVFFVLVSGFTRKNKRLLVFAFVVLIFQSGLLWGVFPMDPEISWESHLFGAMTGIFLALLFKKEGPQADKTIEWEEDLEEEVDAYKDL